MGEGKRSEMENGLVSRSGWAVIDDSWTTPRSDGGRSYALAPNATVGYDWWAERADSHAMDTYLLGYGNNYKQALADYTKIAGSIPLPPDYVFGYWYSKYSSYSADDYRKIMSDLKSNNIPADVMILDMDWHWNGNAGSMSEGRGGWTGWSWNTNLIPDGKGLLKEMHDQHFKTALNLHPADGVNKTESPDYFAKMNAELGGKYLNDAGDNISWNIDYPDFTNSFFKNIIRDHESEGVDFWWLDWQQWLTSPYTNSLSETFWCNHVFFNEAAKREGKRPVIFHRWGGLGNHRYQIGFSGDAIISWKSLDFQPYFNSTASNVLYGYWSHDMGGHMGAHSIDPEMYIRWMQFGAFSPILRTHSTKDAGLNKEPWVFADRERDILHDIIRQRYQFAPYIYSMARRTYDDALPLCRPMYYDYPESEEAYANRNEYMFGDNVLVYPITSPMHDGISTQQVWLPAGCDWYELSSGTLLRGGQTIERKFQLDEYPVYVKAGSVLPEYGKVENLSSTSEPITVAVYPGKGDSSFTLYEDNGNDKHYASEYATTLLTKRTLNDSTIAVTIGARKGTYKDMPANRHYTLKLVASAVPASVQIDGAEASYAYDGNNLSVLIDIPDTDCAKEKTVTIAFPQNATPVADGLIGKFRHIQQGCVALKNSNPGFVFNEQLGTMESTGVAISYAPQEAAERIEAFRRNYANLKQVLVESGIEEAEADKFVQKAY